MNRQPGSRQRQRPLARLWRVVRLLLITLLLAGGIVLMLLFPFWGRSSRLTLEVGAIAPEDVIAPRDFEYFSAVETEVARQQALALVEEVYNAPDSRIGRQQVRLARQIMAFVRDVRADSFADPGLKTRYLGQITALDLPPETRLGLITISDSQFDQLEAEVVKLVEELMSGPVKEDQLDATLSQIELKVSTDLPDDLIPLSIAVARDLVEPNTVINVAATEDARRQAIADIPEIFNSYQAGEIIVRAGEPLDELDIEVLAHLGIGREEITRFDVASALLAALMATVVLGVYVGALQPDWLSQPGRLLLIVALFLLFLLTSQLMSAGQSVLIYLFPAAALSMALAAIFGLELSAMVTLVMAALVGFLANRSLEVTVFTALSGLLAAGSMRRGGRLNTFFIAGMFASIGAVTTLLIFRLPTSTAPADLAQLLLLGLINGLFSAGLALVILFIVGNLTTISTTLRLLDLMRADHPLQRRLQREALGTYQHTLAVANVAEAAAEAIGADTLLTRVGTLYHDIGKMSNPGFFVENQVEGAPDPHKGLSPLASARIIIAHVVDGIKIAGRYRLPPRIVDFIREHHGTMPVLFFLNKAREESANAGITLDESEYHYPGPRPRSRETAILMLADGCESAARAARPTTSEQIEAIVNRIFQQRMDFGQLDESGLTLDDIRVIQGSITRTLKGMYHPRIQYPEVRPADAPAIASGAKAALPGSTPDGPPSSGDEQAAAREAPPDEADISAPAGETRSRP